MTRILALKQSTELQHPVRRSMPASAAPAFAGREQDLAGVSEVVSARLRDLQVAPTMRLDASRTSQAATIAADWVTIFGLVATSQWLLGGAGVHPNPPIDSAVVSATVMCCILAALGAYRNLEGPCRLDAVTTIVNGSALSTVLLLGVSPFLDGGRSIPLRLLIGLPLVVMGLVAQRLLLGRLERRLCVGRLTPALIYGAGATGRLLAGKLLQQASLGLEPAGFLDDDPMLLGTSIRVGEGTKGARLPVLGPGAALGEALDRTGAAAVFMALPSSSSARIAATVREVESRGLSVHCVPGTHQPFGSLRVSTVGGIPVLGRRRPASGAAYTLTKRILDIVGSLALLVATAPILLVAGLLVRWSSPGPVMFTQRRVGLNGRLFTIYKLRTMHRESPSYAFHPDTPSDERVTRVGRWLRKSSLDELPQLYNILRGDMSLVGPRPEMPFIVASYDDTQLQRLMVKPGLTGLWQISLDRAFRIHENIHHDLHYVEQHSLAVDLAILILTPFMLMTQHSAK